VAYKGAAAAPKSVVRSKEQARGRAQQAASRAKAGEDFSALVTEYSDDPTVHNQGNLGLFTRESKDRAFADAAFALPVDAVSDLVETKYGFHIIKRNQ
jgi:parvulin-like peptidyl-prolyl isomerase